MAYKRIVYRVGQVISALMGMGIENSRFEKEKFEGILEGEEGRELSDNILKKILSDEIKPWIQDRSEGEVIRNRGILDDSLSSSETKSFSAEFEDYTIRLERSQRSGYNALSDTSITRDCLEVLRKGDTIGSLANGERVSDAYEFVRGSLD